MTTISRRICFSLPSVFLLLQAALVAWADDRPNLVVIMVDDMGYSDLGCYGSEIDTPNLDLLAQNGLRFSQFYNTAKCHSSRVSLLTGQYCIAAGDTSLSHAVTSAEVLEAGGYFTAMTGKWHLKQQPTDFGFDRYFGHLSGACNFFLGDKTFRLNGQPWTVPSEGFYTTVADVDFALEFLDEARQTGKPWYLYIAFNAPHAPLHALAEDYAKYKGRYQHGWDEVRRRRVEKQKRIGLFPDSMTPSQRPEHVPAWNDLLDWQRSYESNRMSTLAAMIDRIDQEVGRLVADLRKNGELENTLILFVSDNGACPYDRKPAQLDVEPTSAEIAFADSTGWSWARNSPFRFYKQNQFEGGIATPGIVHWPEGLKTPPGDINRTPVHLIDVLPTLSEITNCEIPSQWPGRELRPVSGTSLRPILDGEEIAREQPIHLLFATDRGLRDGDWKLVSFRGEAWELYNLATDRTETQDLAEQEPKRLEQMVEKWHAVAQGTLHAPNKFVQPVKPAQLPHLHPEWTNFDAKVPADYPGRKKSAKRTAKSRSARQRRPIDAIRARKNTQMTIVGDVLQLTFIGEDPGIAMDLRGHQVQPGPYQLHFSLTGGSVGGGEVFYTTDPQTILPKGERIEFEVIADGKPQDVLLEVPTDTQLCQLRIDVSDGPGEATIKGLRLTDTQGGLILAWPKPQ